MLHHANNICVCLFKYISNWNWTDLDHILVSYVRLMHISTKYITFALWTYFHKQIIIIFIFTVLNLMQILSLRWNEKTLC